MKKNRNTIAAQPLEAVEPSAKKTQSAAVCDKDRLAESVDSLAYRANEGLDGLTNLAISGNKAAAKSLVNSLTFALLRFERLCGAMPELFEPMARNTSCWPGFLTCSTNIEKRNTALVAKLNLGRDSELNFSGKQASEEILETRIAFELHAEVWNTRESWKRLGESHRESPRLQKGLPWLFDDAHNLAKNVQPLTRKNYVQWFEAAWPLFIANHGKAFENHKHFAHYWRNAIYMESTPGNDREKQLKPNARALIRDAIKKKIKQSFRSIAAKSNK